jgi:hypothetical protein
MLKEVDDTVSIVVVTAWCKNFLPFNGISADHAEVWLTADHEGITD